MSRAASATAYLGVDLGTSAVKAVLVAPDGTTLAAARSPLEIVATEPRAAEQDAELWWRAAVESIRGCLASRPDLEVEAVGLTGQKHALLPLDHHGRPLAPARLWADGRAQREAADLAARLPALARRTGAPALPGYLVPKWLHLRRDSPQVAARTAHLCFAKDWLRWRLTGRFATDRTEASASQLYDPRRRTWSEALCRLFEVPEGFLPPVGRCTALAGSIDASGAAATGLERGVPVVAGAGDNEAAALACGAIENGFVAVTLGTSGTVVARAERRGPVGGLVWGSHVLARGLAATGTLLSCGRALDWVREAVFPAGATTERVLQAAFDVDADEGLPVFLPSLVGERSPVPDSGARAAFAGLAPHHEAPHLARSVLEGVAASLGQIVTLLRRARVTVRELRLTGGGAASPRWRRLVAAASDAPIRALSSDEGAARGAAALAAARGGTDRDLVALARRWAHPGTLEEPPREEIERLARLSRRLSRLRAALAAARG